MKPLFTSEFKTIAICEQLELEKFGINTEVVLTQKGWEVQPRKKTENGTRNANSRRLLYKY